MMGKRKASDEEKRNYNVDEKVMDNAAAIAALGVAARRTRKRFVGVRQRPSGRWVAGIKDTIQKIRVWLGTYDTAEKAARAYDEATYLLRGANTRTNFWPFPPSSHSKPALPSKIANLLLLRLKARNNSASAASMVSNLPVNAQGYQAGDGEVKCFDDFFNVPEDCSININNSDTSTTCSSTSTITTFSSTTVSDCMLQTFGSNFAKTEDGDDLKPIHLDDNWGNVDGDSYIERERKEKREESESGEEIDLEGQMDFQFLDSLGSSRYCSPFKIAEEMVEPPMEQQENIHDDDPSMLTETMKRMKYERKFSASLYAFNGIPDCLRLKQHESGDNDKPAQQSNVNRDSYSNQEGEHENKVKEKHGEEMVVHGIPETSIETGPSAYTSLSNEAGHHEMWSSLDLPSIYFMS